MMGGWFPPGMILAEAKKCCEFVDSRKGWEYCLHWKHGREIIGYIEVCEPYSMARLCMQFQEATIENGSDLDPLVAQILGESITIQGEIGIPGDLWWQLNDDYEDYIQLCSPHLIARICEDLMEIEDYILWDDPKHEQTNRRHRGIDR